MDYPKHAAAAIELSNGDTRIYYQATICERKGRGPVSSGYSNPTVLVGGEKVRDGTPIAVTTWGANFDQIRLYFIDSTHHIRELNYSNATGVFATQANGFDDKKYLTQHGSTLLYAVSTPDGNPTVGFQSYTEPKYITEARLKDGVWSGSAIVEGVEDRGFITLVNGTSYRWDCSNKKSFAMSSWIFPPFIGAGKSVSVYVERKAGATSFMDKAEYTLAGTTNVFTVQAAKGLGDNLTLSVVLKSMHTQNNAQGATIDLGWSSSRRRVNFILSGKEGWFSSTNMPMDWMHANLSRLGSRTLRQLCIPGSHDAGMSQAKQLTEKATKGNVITQRQSIGGQLRAGSRYFDIRPVIRDGESSYDTGHYFPNPEIAGLEIPINGGNGQSIDSIIEEINAFTDTNKELIILRLFHDIKYKDTRGGQRLGKPFGNTSWNNLFTELKKINYRFSTSATDLTTLPLNEFIGGDKAAVIMIVKDGVNLPENEGFYHEKRLKTYNEFSNIDNTNEMAWDQIKKMHKERTSPDSPHFVLCWTLTQTAKPVLDLADVANPELYKRLLPSCTPQSYPNVLYTDAMDNSDAAALAMVINNNFGSA